MPCKSYIRCSYATLGVFFLAGVPELRAEAVSPELYQAEVIVTGVREAERLRGFREGIKEIVGKLTGNYALDEGTALQPFLSHPADFIQEFTYEDRMKHLLVRDEQGTRDRPFYLRMTANSAKLSSALDRAGLKIWEDRPEIEVLLTVEDARGRMLIGAEGEALPGAAEFLDYRIAQTHYDGYEQREVVKSVAAKHGLAIVLPTSKDLEFKLKSQERISLTCPFHTGSANENCIRYRGELTFLPSGRWRLDARAWSLSPDSAYMDLAGCFHIRFSEVTFDTALRDSLDAIAAWGRVNRDAVRCGLPGKF